MTSAHPLHVLIAGGGLSRLALAQGLIQDGHRCEVFERDTRPSGSWRPEARPPSQAGPGRATGGRVREPGSGPPMSSRNGGYLSVISPA